MSKSSTYTSKIPGPDGRFTYDAEETAIWGELFARQMDRLKGFACRAYLEGQQKLGFRADTVPQVADIDARLHALTGAGAAPVAAIIPQAEFSGLLRQRKFPVATFLRRREDIDYIEEPDLFHEVFGHCPMLTDPAFCDFMERFGRLAAKVPKNRILRPLKSSALEISLRNHPDASGGNRSTPARACDAVWFTLMTREPVSGAAEQRMLELLQSIAIARASESYLPLFRWTITDGLQRLDIALEPQAINSDPTDVLKHIRAVTKPGIFVLLDFHPFLEDPVHVRLLKDICIIGHGQNITQSIWK